ncbi:DNA primase [Candidatus Protofrankia californiensis]|uniref:DNA primase n=1 Tax=Candidatus Protofrankia californiensis TaxID=1839754 RepID=A0A1C3NXM1_9ACTN|nr:DNA primase [Candidatus Protofrankia californiensis]
MAGRIRDADVAAVRDRSPLADIVGDYVQLRPVGSGQLRGLCPFHDEKTPSFNVRPQVGAYHCFGCGVGGDVIAFVRAIDGLSFPEAVERLARRAGITLTYEGGGVTSRAVTSQRQRLLDAHRVAAEFYAERLESADAGDGRDFLSARGFDREAAARFGVGYAPAGWDTLTRHLMGRHFTAAELVLGGLAKQSSRGSLIDRFHRRLVWPIHDLAGDVVGFGARRLAADDPGPKYLNTPETPLFKKANLLYGADIARREIARRYQVVVVEGYTDVMACHLAGVPTAVASCGTAFGSEHVTVLRRLLMDQSEHRGEVVFTFDGDEAGRKAAIRAFEFEERFVTQTFVAIEPSGLDPCDLRIQRGDAAVCDLVAARVPLVEFAIRGKLTGFDLNTTEGRLAALDAAAPLINRLKDRGLRHRYAVNLDNWLGFLDEEFVVRRVAEHQPRGGIGGVASLDGPVRGRVDRPDRSRQRDVVADDAVVAVEREVLKVALQYPGLAGPVFDTLSPELFTVRAHHGVREVIAAAGGVCAGLSAAGDVSTWVSAVAEAAGQDELRRFVIELAVEAVFCDHDVDDRYVDEQMSRVQELQVTRRIADLKSRVQRLNPVTDAETFKHAYGELIALEQHKRQLRERGLGAA